jgi:catechol 2,3-dioxygenase-like lactoylglutathione lyase family enzyme
MPRSLALTSFLVPDYDEALSFFTGALRFTVMQDTLLSPGKRWVVVAPSGTGGALLLAGEKTPDKRALVGRQGGGRVWLFLHTDDLDADRAHMAAHGVAFAEAPRTEAYGRVVVFTDPWGNRWDLIQPAAAA